MAKYKNKKTGAIIETNGKISGGNWVEVLTKKSGKKDDKKEPEKKPESVSTEDDDSGAEDSEDGEDE